MTYNHSYHFDMFNLNADVCENESESVRIKSIRPKHPQWNPSVVSVTGALVNIPLQLMTICFKIFLNFYNESELVIFEHYFPGAVIQT